MRLAARAATLVVEGVEEHMAGVENIITRRVAAGSVPVSGLTPGVIVGIAIGCASFVLLAGLVIIMPVLYIRHLRKLDERNRILIASDAVNPNNNLPVTLPPRTFLRQSGHRPNNSLNAWGLLPSQDDVSTRNNVVESPSRKRKSEGLPWLHAEKKTMKRRMLGNRFRRSSLSSIPESPSMGFILDDVAAVARETGPIEPAGNNEAGSLMHGGKPVSEAQTTRSSTEMKSNSIDIDNAANARGHSIFSISALIPIIDLTSTNEDTVGRRSRSFSDPIAREKTFQKRMSAVSSSGMSSKRASRALSVEGQVGAPPTAPLPPLPSDPDHQSSPRAALVEGRMSTNSISSLESRGTSILNSPNKDRVSKEWPGPSNDPQLKYLDDKNDRKFGTSPTGRPRWSTSGPKFPSSAASLRSTSERSSRDLKRYSNDNEAEGAPDVNRFSGGFLETAEIVNFSRPNSSASPKELGCTTSQTPKRDSQVRKVRSADQFGSPVERHRDSTGQDLPIATRSETSLLTVPGSGSSNGLLKGTALSGEAKSSSAKVTPSPRKKHARKKSIRDSLQLAHGRSPSRPTSSIKMGLIAEEGNETPGDVAVGGSRVNSLRSNRSSSVAQLRNPRSYRASLATRSSDITFVDYEELWKSYGVGDRSPSPAAPSSLQSNKSSNHSPKNPKIVDGHVNPVQKDAKTVQDASNEELTIRLISPGSTSPTSPSGLTLLEQNNTGNENSRSSRFSSSPSANPSVWGSSPPLPRSLSPPPKSKATTELSESAAPVMKHTHQSSWSKNPTQTKPDFSPPKELPLSPARLAQPRQRTSTSGPNVLTNAAVLRGMNKDTRAVEAQNNKTYRVFPSEDEYGDEEKENQGYRREGGVWHGLHDLEDFWGTSQNKRRSALFTNGPRSLHSSGSKKRVAWGGVDVRENTPTLTSEGDVSFGEDDFF